MVAFTTNFDLPFPDSSDAPCDFAEQWCDFTDAVDAVFDRFQATLDRTVPMIPIALLKVSEPVLIGTFNNIPYDTVVIDSAGWTAVDIDNTMISPDMAGVMTWSVGTIVEQQLNPNAYMVDPQDSRGLLTEPNFPYTDQIDFNSVPVAMPLPLAVLFSDGGWVPGLSGLRNNVVALNVGTFTIMDAFFTVYWHADGGTL